ncbi:unnamed protein product [Closterium sp. NIES-53]
MASLHILAFDHEGRTIQFDTWLDDLQLYLLRDSRDSVSLFDHTSGPAPPPPATADTATRSKWLTRDAAARLAIRNHLLLAVCAHFGQHRTAQALYDAVVTRYSSPATAALGRLLLPYLLPELSAFATLEDLVSHLRTSDALYRVAAPAEFLDRNQPPIVTRLPDSLRSVRDHFLVLDPTDLTVGRLKQHLLAAETSVVAVGATRGTPRTPFFEGMSELLPQVGSAATARARVAGVVDVAAGVVVGAAVEVVEAVEVVAAVGVVAGLGAWVAVVEAAVGVVVVAAAGVVALGLELSVEVLEEARGRGSSVGARLRRPSSFTCGKPHTPHRCFSRLDDAWRAEFGDEVERPHWAELFRSGVVIFDLDYDAILSAMYALSASAEGDCYRYVPLDPGSSLYTLATEPPQTLLWHHRPGHPSLPRLRGMHSRLLVSGLPRSLPPLPPSPATLCLPCIKGWQRAAPHSSSIPPTTAPLQTLHMDVWGPSRVSGQGREHYFLLVIDNFTRYTTVFPLRSKGQVVDVLIPWIRTVRLQLRERFRTDLPRCIGLVMEVARTSTIHAAAPHFLWPFAVRYAAHQLNLWPRVSLPETSPTLRWTGKVGDASVFRVWGSRAFVRDTSMDKLSARAIPCVFLGFSPDAPDWQFYHPTSRCVFPSQDVMFDVSVPFYRLFPYRSVPPLPPPLFLAPGPPPVDPLPPQGPSLSGVSQLDPLSGIVPVEVAGNSRAASGGAEPGGVESEGTGFGGAEPGGAEPAGAEPAGVEPGGAEHEGVEPWGVEPEGVEPGGAESEGAESRGVVPRGAALSRGPAGASPSLSPCSETLSPEQLRARVPTVVGGTGGTAAAGPGGARTKGTGAAGTDGVGGAGAGDPMEPGAAGAGGAGAGGTRAAGGPGAGGARGTVRPRPYFVPLLQQSRPASSVCTGRRVPRPRPPPVPGTHAMALRPSYVPLHVPLPPPHESSLPVVPGPESEYARAASPSVSRLLATVVTDPSFESTTTSTLVAELLDFAAACRLDYATALVSESESAM